MAGDVEDCEEPKLADNLVSRACLCERVGKRRLHPPILHANNGNVTRAATLVVCWQSLAC